MYGLSRISCNNACQDLSSFQMTLLKQSSGHFPHCFVSWSVIEDKIKVDCLLGIYYAFPINNFNCIYICMNHRTHEIFMMKIKMNWSDMNKFFSNKMSVVSVLTGMVWMKEGESLNIWIVSIFLSRMLCDLSLLLDHIQMLCYVMDFCVSVMILSNIKKGRDIIFHSSRIL